MKQSALCKEYPEVWVSCISLLWLNSSFLDQLCRDISIAAFGDDPFTLESSQWTVSLRTAHPFRASIPIPNDPVCPLNDQSAQADRICQPPQSLSAAQTRGDPHNRSARFQPCTNVLSRRSTFDHTCIEPRARISARDPHRTPQRLHPFEDPLSADQMIFERIFLQRPAHLHP